MGWNYLSIPKLQRLHRWSLGMDKLFHPTHYNGCNYLSMLGLKLIHVSKRGYWCHLYLTYIGAAYAHVRSRRIQFSNFTFIIHHFVANAACTQVSAFITRSNITWHCTHNGRISIGVCTHKRLVGELCREYSKKKWPRYNGTTLYIQAVNTLWLHRGRITPGSLVIDCENSKSLG